MDVASAWIQLDTGDASFNDIIGNGTLTINSTSVLYGNVVIGSTNPTANLLVYGNIQGKDDLQLFLDAAGRISSGSGPDSQVGRAISFKGTDDTTVAHIKTWIETNKDHWLQFTLWDNAGNYQSFLLRKNAPSGNTEQTMYIQWPGAINNSIFPKTIAGYDLGLGTNIWGSLWLRSSIKQIGTANAVKSSAIANNTSHLHFQDLEDINAINNHSGTPTESNRIFSIGSNFTVASSITTTYSYIRTYNWKNNSTENTYIRLSITNASTPTRHVYVNSSFEADGSIYSGTTDHESTHSVVARSKSGTISIYSDYIVSTSNYSRGLYFGPNTIDDTTYAGYAAIASATDNTTTFRLYNANVNKYTTIIADGKDDYEGMTYGNRQWTIPMANGNRIFVGTHPDNYPYNSMGVVYAVNGGSNDSTYVLTTPRVKLYNHIQIATSRNNTNVDIRVTGLVIYGSCYGNTAAHLVSNTAGVFRYMDGGPQLIFASGNADPFGAAADQPQIGALIFTDNDQAGTGVSFHFVSNQNSDNNGGDLTVTAPRFRARKGLTIGQNTDNTSYNLYVNGTSYFNGNTTHNGNLTFESTGGSGTTGTSGKITWSGSTDAVDIYYYVPTSDQGNLVFNTRDDTNCLLAFAYNGTIKAYINNSTPSFYPATTNTGTIGTSTYEWGNTYTRIIYARHFDASYPFTDNRDMYYGYNKGANHYFYSMDGTTRTHLATLSTDFTVQNGYLKSTKNGNTVTIGSQNTSFTHIYNSANIPFIFNKDVLVTDTKNLGSTSWPWGNLYIGTADGAGIYYVTSNYTKEVIRFLNHSADQYGVGLKICTGGLIIIGAGESGDTIQSNLAPVSGAENLYLAADSSIYFYPSNNSYDAAARIEMTAGRIWAGVNGNTTRENQIGVQSGAGQIYMWSHASTTGDRGIWVTAHGSGAAHAIFSVNTNNQTAFADYYNNTMTKLAYSQSGLAASAITWLTCWNGYELRAISKAEMANATDSAHKWVRIGGDTMTGTFNINTGANPDGNSLGHGLRLWHDSEGGNIRIYSGNCSSNGSYYWEIDAYNGNLRFYNVNSAGTYKGEITMKKDNVMVTKAQWNDYAECRKTEKLEAGRVVTESNNNIMQITSKRLLPGCRVISDTYGHLIGYSKEAQTPIAVSGRVLVYPYQNRSKYELGAAVCSAPNGTVDIMTRDEIMMYPERIIGTVSEIPDYDNWYSSDEIDNESIPIKVNGRIWIYVK